jgi:hypothetical protein
MSHAEMCMGEGKSLQQGMNFRSDRPYSVILACQRKNAPYADRMSDDGKTMFYVGHDAYGASEKGQIDQPLATHLGTLTQNGKFFQAAEGVRQGRGRELVRVYEKLGTGVWVFNGLFDLRDARMESAPCVPAVSDSPGSHRKVCVFELHLIESADDLADEDLEVENSPGRIIPTDVKLIVLKRDKGRCVKCGSTTNLHFDHILAWTKGGSSTNPLNIQLLCQKHNLRKSDLIE